MVIEATGTGIHGSHQHKGCGKIHRKAGTGNRYPALLHGLPHYFQHRAFEFGEFIEEKYPVMRQRYLSGLRNAAATYEGHISRTIKIRKKLIYLCFKP